MNLKEQLIEEVLAGKFDVKKAAAEYEAEKKNELALRAVWDNLNLAMQKKNWDEATAKLAEAEKLIPEGGRVGLDIMH